MNSETQYADTEVEELMAMLRETESLEEQGDILQYLASILPLLYHHLQISVSLQIYVIV